MMSAWGKDSVRKWSIRIAAIFAAVAAGGLLVAWLGLYNIAASKGHWDVTRALLEFGMRNSVATWSSMIDERPLDDPDLVRLGASHFQSGCAPCHGAPGEPANPIARSMLPPPPSLITHVPTWRNRELFWIVKHGIKYAGMPAWTTQKRNDEVWAIVAFLVALPNLSSRGYRRLAYGEVDRPDASVEQFLSTGLIVPQIGPVPSATVIRKRVRTASLCRASPDRTRPILCTRWQTMQPGSGRAASCSRSRQLSMNGCGVVLRATMRL